MPHIRNWAARSPLMRKGGAHVISKSSQRQHCRLADKLDLEEWYDERAEALYKATMAEQDKE